jgi:hypothetical protein
MSYRSVWTALAILGALALAISPALACERHQQHSTSISQAAPVAPPVSSIEPSTGAAIVISPAAAAAMSVTQALGSEPYDMRCPRMRGVKEALTQ